MDIYEAFEHLINNWEKQTHEFRHKNRMWKSRYLDKSGNQGRRVSESKMRELLLECGYKENWTK